MKWIVSVLSVILLSVIAFAYYARDHIDFEQLQMYVPFSIAKILYLPESRFAAYSIPLKETHWLFDTGIVDANGDNHLDIFTTNHNWKQYLLISDTQGGYSDKLEAWGLEQNSEYPGLEISHIHTVADKPGLYLYWDDRYFHIRAYNIGNSGKLTLDFQTYTRVDVLSNEGFHLEKIDHKSLTPTTKPDTAFRLTADGDALLKLYPDSRGIPINIKLNSSISPDNVYIGNQKVTASGDDIALFLQDPHAMSWSDYNDDGQTDVFITRGAIGGTLRAHPESIIDITKDKLLVSREGQPDFHDIGYEVGIRKNFCSSRHASWVDFNNDGLLDLFVNCQDIGRIKGDYPKQLYKRNEHNKLSNVTETAGLILKDHHLIDYEWLDADNDGDMDLVSHEDEGIFLHRNENGWFSSEFVYRGKFARVDRPELKGRGIAYWNFDGKLTVSDYDRDGDIDIFAASKKGNIFLENRGGEFSPVEPASLGLPKNTVSAAWVDYDNDGLVDLHTVPQGLFRQREDHLFEKTGQLELPVNEYQAAIINWFDLDNDGARDVMIALNKNPTLRRWWEFSSKDPFKWDVLTYRNLESANHWLEIKLKGNTGNREGIGARVIVTTPAGRQTQEVGNNDGAFFSQGHYRLYFGLGDYGKADNVEIRWSDGEVQLLGAVPADQLLVVDRESEAEVTTRAEM
jgi:hypothetical protein